MVATYATLAQVKGEQLATSTTDDDKLMARVMSTCARIDKIMGSGYRYFMPWIRTITIPVTEFITDSVVNTLALPYPLLELTSLTYNGTAMVVNTDVEAYVPGVTPYRLLRLKSTAYTWHTWDGYNSAYPVPLVAVTGIWGYHSDYVNAWLSVDTLTAAIATTSITTLTVGDVDGDDAYGFSPRISRGALLKIDDEFLEVIDTNTTTNVVTVKRGANGSTAATHMQDTAVYTWQPEADITDVVMRQASLKYTRRGAFEVSTFNEAGVTTSYPQDLLMELKGVLQNYVYG